MSEALTDKLFTLAFHPTTPEQEAIAAFLKLKNLHNKNGNSDQSKSKINKEKTEASSHKNNYSNCYKSTTFETIRISKFILIFKNEENNFRDCLEDIRYEYGVEFIRKLVGSSTHHYSYEICFTGHMPSFRAEIFKADIQNIFTRFNRM
jgi:hypothetical protein